MRIRNVIFALALGLALLAVGLGCDDDSGGGKADGAGAGGGAEGEGEAGGGGGGGGGAGDEGEGEGPAEGEGEGEGEGPGPAAPDGCVEDDAGPLAAVACAGTVVTPGLSAPAQVVYDGVGAPHIYGANRLDVARVHGYVVARDRYFGMELARRSARGQLSGWLSTLALSRSILDRTLGKPQAAERTLAGGITADTRAVLDAYAAGVNLYVERALAGDDPPPSEMEILTLGTGEDAAALMERWTALDAVAVGIEIVYQEGWDSEDMGRARALALADQFGLDAEGNPLPDAQARREAAIDGILMDFAPLFHVIQHPGARAKPDPAVRAGLAPSGAAVRGLPAGLVRPAGRVLDLIERILPTGRDRGSNAWAVSAELGDGGAWLANDPHLSFGAPTFFYQVHADSELRHDGTDEPMQVGGVAIPGIPVPVAGFTDRVAWGVTRLHGDLQDFYLERITLDGQGRPTTTVGLGGPEPLRVIPETYDVVGFVLQGTARTQCTIRRYETSTGRVLLMVEGDDREAPADCNDDTAVNVGGAWVVPRDTDGDQVITGVSADFTGLDPNGVVEVFNGYFAAQGVAQAVEAERHAVALNNSKVFADTAGGVASSAYQGLPLRSYLRDGPGGAWADGAHPSFLLDGAEHPDFQLDLDADLRLVTDSADPRKQAVAWEDYPRTIRDDGYVVVANNDPTGGSFDADSGNDTVYIAEDFAVGFRADRITGRLDEYAAAGTPIGLPQMAAIQGDHRSNVAVRLLRNMLPALDGEAPECGDAADPRFREVAERLRAWGPGHTASSGVQTFYDPAPTEEARAEAVATTVFNTWLSAMVEAILDDEHLDGMHWNMGHDTGRVRLVTRMVDALPGPAGGRPATHVFWDDTSTPETVEAPETILCRALTAALDLLAGDTHGGYGTDDMDAWLWGLRHTVRFIHPIDAILGGDETAGPLVSPYSIKPENLPVAEGLDAADPRASLSGYPRPGDNFNVDAAHNGFGTPDTFETDTGPVQRLIVQMTPDGPRAWNAIPGGQSGHLGDPHWADQARLWLANERHRLPWTPEEVAAAGKRRVVFMPAP